MKTVKLVLADLARLANPTTALALVALLAQLIPGVSIPGALLAGILCAVGAIAGFVDRLLAEAGGSVPGALKLAVLDIAKLRNPATAAAVVALVVELLPGVLINGQALAGILAAVGVMASFIRTQAQASPSAPAPAPAPTPVPAPTPASKKPAA